MYGDVFWKGRFNLDMRRFDGLRSFMRYYTLKMYSIVQFDYYGNDIFKVIISKTNMVECNYPTTHVDVFIKNKNTVKWKPKEYILGQSNIEYEKHASLWSFNGYWNSSEFKEMKVSKSDIDPKSSSMVCYRNNRNIKYMIVLTKLHIV